MTISRYVLRIIMIHTTMWIIYEFRTRALFVTIGLFYNIIFYGAARFGGPCAKRPWWAPTETKN